MIQIDQPFTISLAMVTNLEEIKLFPHLNTVLLLKSVSVDVTSQIKLKMIVFS